MSSLASALLIMVILAASALGTISASPEVDLSPSQAAAMVALKHRFQPFGWVNESAICLWPGVGCLGNDVTMLRIGVSNPRVRHAHIVDLVEPVALEAAAVPRDIFPGPFPEEICALVRLTVLYMGAMNLLGSLPSCLSSLELVSFSLNYNYNVTCSLASFVNLTSSWTSLQALEISEVNFYGPLSVSPNWASLRTLSLVHMPGVYGPVDESFCDLLDTVVVLDFQNLPFGSQGLPSCAYTRNWTNVNVVSFVNVNLTGSLDFLHFVTDASSVLITRNPYLIGPLRFSHLNCSQSIDVSFNPMLQGSIVGSGNESASIEVLHVMHTGVSSVIHMDTFQTVFPNSASVDLDGSWNISLIFGEPPYDWNILVYDYYQNSSIMCPVVLSFPNGDWFRCSPVQYSYSLCSCSNVSLCGNFFTGCSPCGQSSTTTGSWPTASTTSSNAPVSTGSSSSSSSGAHVRADGTIVGIGIFLCGLICIAGFCFVVVASVVAPLAVPRLYSRSLHATARMAKSAPATSVPLESELLEVAVIDGFYIEPQTIIEDGVLAMDIGGMLLNLHSAQSNGHAAFMGLIPWVSPLLDGADSSLLLPFSTRDPLFTNEEHATLMLRFQLSMSHPALAYFEGMTCLRGRAYGVFKAPVSGLVAVNQLMEGCALHYRFSPRDVFVIAERLVSGLSYLHGLTPSVPHCYLNGDSVLVESGSLQPYVLGFGLMSPTRLTAVGGDVIPPAGCEAYYPAECLRQSGVISTHSSSGVSGDVPLMTQSMRTPVVKYSKIDVYSFGVLMCQMLSSQPPFSRLDPDQVISAVLAGSIPDIPSYTPPSFSRLITLCLHSDPDQRPPFALILSHWLPLIAFELDAVASV